MTHLRPAILFALTVAALGCSWRRTPVPVISDSGSITALVGEWNGDYNSSETGRSGSITFQLASEKDTAFGDVVMVPRVHAVQSAMQERSGVNPTTTRAAPEPLKIRFVRMEGGRVSGKLAPYDDPDCGCRVITTFEGTFTDSNTIAGTYETHGAGLLHQAATGQWKVARQNSKITTP